ncbi:MAG: formylglycine-generating enzyme family protein [Paludibacteraceae bacterium]|nr:formylglycine-generating enzyme family protein [Paludibacteraceae bacterium]
MKRLLIIMLAALSLTAFAQDVKKVAILETVDRAGDVPYGVKLQVRMNLTYAISNTPGYEGYDRVDMSSIMGEQNFQRTGMVSNAQIKKLGEMTGAQYVLIAEAALYDAQNIIITAKVLDVETGGVSNSAPPAFAGKDPEKMQEACVSLARKLLGGRSSSSASYSSYSSSSRSYGANQDFVENAWDINMKMIWVEGGEFMMGCTSEQSGCESDEQNVRRVTVDGFYIGMLEVTQSQWEKVVGTNIYTQKNKANASGTRGVGPDYPMYYVSWEEAMEFCRLLSNKTGKTYTLPTEAQWEYAARGGKKAESTKYAGSNMIDAVAWYTDNSGGSTHPCGTKRANALGIYDMSGNVWEWCKDWYSSSYTSYDTNNPTGPSSGSSRVDRGGGWDGDAAYCRVAYRDSYSPGDRHYGLGFRIVLLP